MGDPTKFQWIMEYYTFNVFLLLLVISEVFIFFYTHSGIEKNIHKECSASTFKKAFTLNVQIRKQQR